MYDETYTSARKRRQTGIEALEDVPENKDNIMLDYDSESSEASSI